MNAPPKFRFKVRTLSTPSSRAYTHPRRSTSHRLRAITGRFRRLRREEPLAAAPRPAMKDHHYPVGTLLVEREFLGTPYGLRMVIGYSNGSCLTVAVTPPPWLTAAESSRVHRGLAGLVEVSRAAQRVIVA